MTGPGKDQVELAGTLPSRSKTRCPALKHSGPNADSNPTDLGAKGGMNLGAGRRGPQADPGGRAR